MIFIYLILVSKYEHVQAVKVLKEKEPQTQPSVCNNVGDRIAVQLSNGHPSEPLQSRPGCTTQNGIMDAHQVCSPNHKQEFWR
jgi:hypothetical protein